jgi:hypothetical protein
VSAIPQKWIDCAILYFDEIEKNKQLRGMMMMMMLRGR